MPGDRETGADGELIRGKCIREGMTAALAAYPARTAGKTGCAKADEKTTDILIFAGTTEGRLLAEYASAKGIGCYVSVATEYGETLLRDLEKCNRPHGTDGRAGDPDIYRRKKIRLVIDATHPFARAGNRKYPGGLCGGRETSSGALCAVSAAG